MKRSERTPKYSHEAYITDDDGRKYSQWDWTPGIASEFIRHLSELATTRQRLRVVLYVRVSSRRQLHDGNLQQAVALAKRELRQMGCTVIAVFAEVSHSSIYFVSDQKGYTRNRWQFEDAIEFAKEHEAVLVAPERDRFIRGRFLNTRTGRHEVPTIGEFKDLVSLTKGMTLATIHPPDAPARGRQIKRGLQAKGSRVGRPSSDMRGRGCIKRRREALLPIVDAMRANGWSHRKIAKVLMKRGWKRVASKTICNWLRRRDCNG
jgi:hypothetical protein